MPLPKEIEEMIRKEAENRYDESNPNVRLRFANQVGYIAGAYKYASDMIGFAEWCDENYYGLTTGNWYGPIVSDNKQQVKTTSELLTLYFKNKGIK